MGVQGQSRNYLKKFNFRVEIDGLTIAGFTTCSDIGSEMSMIAHREGGDVEVSDKSFGLITEKPITLTNGATDNHELWQWWQDHRTKPEDEVKKTIAIVALDRAKNERWRYNVPGCFITNFVAASFDNNADENVIQSITLEHDAIDLEVAAA